MSQGRLARLLGATLLGVACVGAPSSSQGADGPVLLRELSVSPLVALSGGVVEIRASIENRGSTPVRGLLVALAVAEDSGVGNVRWNELGQPGQFIPMLLPGERVAISSRAEVSGDGWLRIGFAGQYADGVIFPRGQRIRIVHPALTLVEAITVLAALGSAVALAMLCVLAGLRQIRRNPPAGRTPILVGALVTSLALIVWQQLPLLGQTVPVIVEPLVYLGLLLFAVAWFLASYQAMGSLGGSAFVALSSYLVLGLGWSLMMRLLVGGLPTQILSDPQTAAVVLSWPFQVAQAVLGIKF